MTGWARAAIAISRSRSQRDRKQRLRGVHEVHARRLSGAEGERLGRAWRRPRSRTSTPRRAVTKKDRQTLAKERAVASTTPRCRRRDEGAERRQVDRRDPGPQPGRLAPRTETGGAVCRAGWRRCAGASERGRGIAAAQCGHGREGLGTRKLTPSVQQPRAETCQIFVVQSMTTEGGGAAACGDLRWTSRSSIAGAGAPRNSASRARTVGSGVASISA